MISGKAAERDPGRLCWGTTRVTEHPHGDPEGGSESKMVITDDAAKSPQEQAHHGNILKTLITNQPIRYKDQRLSAQVLISVSIRLSE